jgi:hypothetical protein
MNAREAQLFPCRDPVPLPRSPFYRLDVDHEDRPLPDLMFTQRPIDASSSLYTNGPCCQVRLADHVFAEHKSHLTTGSRHDMRHVALIADASNKEIGSVAEPATAASDESTSTRPLPGGAVAVLAPRPAAGPALAFLKLLLCPPNAALSGGLTLGILDPANELVASQRRDFLPSVECRRVGDQRLAQVSRQFVHHPTGHSLAAHRPMVVSRGTVLEEPSGLERT